MLLASILFYLVFIQLFVALSIYLYTAIYKFVKQGRQASKEREEKKKKADLPSQLE